MTTPASTIRYAAKSAYQLCLMRGIYSATICKLVCTVKASDGFVTVTNPATNEARNVKIAKSWCSL